MTYSPGDRWLQKWGWLLRLTGWLALAGYLLWLFLR